MKNRKRERGGYGDGDCGKRETRESNNVILR